MDFLDTYMNSVWQMPSEHYHDFTQATIDNLWEDNTQIRKIKEQSYPFSDEYAEYEVYVTTVSEFIVNTSKVSGDYVRMMFNDIDHPLNYRGQKYLYAPDGTNENVYLCYDKLNPLTQIPDFKCIRCNNNLIMLGANGEIIKEPCTIGYEITSTNNNITKDATISQRRIVLLVQGNDNTKNIAINQRFIFQNKQAYKITEMNVLNQDDYVSGEVTLYTFYIEWSAIIDKDNLELNIADYYDYNYVLEINSTNLSLSNGDTGQLTATVKANDVIKTDAPLKWSTSDSNVITIDSQGNYQVIGSDGSTAVITCSIDGNDTIYDSINVEVVATPILTKEIIINPNTQKRIRERYSLDVYYGVYEGETLLGDVVTVTSSGADTSNYSLSYLSGFVRVTNISSSDNNLILTFSSGSLDTKQIEIILGGIM